MSTPTIFVLSTQTLPDVLVDAAAASGVQLDAMAFIRTESLAVGDIPSGPVIALFTSQHAVEALPGIGPDWTIYCIEGATRKLVERRFGKGIVTGTAFSAGELADTIIQSGSGKRVVFFCGDNRLDELPFRLRTAGFTVEERIVYQTVQTPQRLERDYDGIAFFSPSGVDSFFSANPVRERTTYFAIGRTTAAAVAARTGRVALVSSLPDKEVLIREMIAHFIL
jgi:uroporphyrinogen-III synthase